MGQFFPSLVHLQTNVCDCQNITWEKLTNMQNLMEVIVASLILKKIIIFTGLKLNIPYATIFHVFLAASRQSCPSQGTCFSPPPLKMPWLHKGIGVKNNLGEESRGKRGAEQGHKGLAALLKSSKGNYFISCVHSMLL